MSCKPGEPCHEGLKRRRALAVLGLMAVIFLALSAVSFIDPRGQAVPAKVTYAGFDAVAGKRVFQSYNCMGCHTIVGNGAYFGPDLTKLYGKVGPAWLEAFLPSAGAWPTSGAVRLQLQDKAIAADAGVETIEAYLEKYPAAAERIDRRGGKTTHMPNLPFSRDEVRGPNYALVGGGYLKQMFRLPDFLGSDVLAGGWVETGAAFTRTRDANLRWSATGAVIIESIFGPLFGGISSGANGGLKFYVALGPIFR